MKILVNEAKVQRRVKELELAEDLCRLVVLEDTPNARWARWAEDMATNLVARAAALSFALSLAGCGMSEQSDERAPVIECVEQAWTPAWCDARSVKQFVVVCEGGERGELGTNGVWSGAPYAACAPAELAADVMAWCCWGHE